jgi:hypothetical protein
MGKFLSLVENLVEAGITAGVIKDKMPWLPAPDEQAIRYTATVNGLEAIVEVQPSCSGVQWLNWAILPRSQDVKFAGPMDRNNWPGQLWGTAYIDRRIGYHLETGVRSHRKRAFNSRLLQPA